jgi:hypothetical protein
MMNKGRVISALQMIQVSTGILKEEIEGQEYVGSESERIFSLTLDLLHNPELGLKDHLAKQKDNKCSE